MDILHKLILTKSQVSKYPDTNHLQVKAFTYRYCIIGNYDSLGHCIIASVVRTLCYSIVPLFFDVMHYSTDSL